MWHFHLQFANCKWKCSISISYLYLWRGTICFLKIPTLGRPRLHLGILFQIYVNNLFWIRFLTLKQNFVKISHLEILLIFSLKIVPLAFIVETKPSACLVLNFWSELKKIFKSSSKKIDSKYFFFKIWIRFWPNKNRIMRVLQKILFSQNSGS